MLNGVLDWVSEPPSRRLLLYVGVIWIVGVYFCINKFRIVFIALKLIGRDLSTEIR